MEKCVVPLSPAWYLSQILDSCWDGRLAYGALNDVVIINPADSLNPDVITVCTGDRVLSLSFAIKGFGNYLAVSCESGLVVVWDLSESKAVLVNEIHKGCPSYTNWSHADGNLIVSADENGQISWWNIKTNSVSSMLLNQLGKLNVVACCPHQRELVAIGTKTGLVCVVNINGKGSLVHKLRGHDHEVTSLVWCPVPENILRPSKVPNHLLLASGGRDKKIFFWRAGDDGLYEMFVHIPSSSGSGSAGSAPRYWTSLCWPKPTVLLASIFSGEVHSLNLETIKKGGNQLVGRAASREKADKWQLFSRDHQQGPVALCTSWKQHDDSSNWRSEEGSGLVWSVGTDRLVLGISLESRKVIFKMATFGGAVHALELSPIDGHSLAVGVADKTIRVVNLSEPNLGSMKTIKQKINGKVMALAWHPSKDGWLAYGTSDGRVGVHFTLTRKEPLLFRLFFKDSIYSMQWGPATLDVSPSQSPLNAPTEQESAAGSTVLASDFVLYTVGGGHLAVFDPNSPDSKPKEPLQSFLKTLTSSGNSKVSVTDLAWKSDFSLLAVGSDKGSIFLLHMTNQRQLCYICTVSIHTVLIQDLAWHPHSCTSDASGDSPFMNWLATASNDVNIRVVDTTPLVKAISSLTDAEELRKISVPCVATLQGHKLRVAKLAWSPHQGGLLLSASYDQCAQVWDVFNNKPVACYTNHSAPVLSCLWSPLSADITLTAGSDSTLRLWKVQEQEHKLPIKKKTDKTLLKGAVSAESGAKGGGKPASSTQNLAPTSPKNRRRKEKSVLPLSGAALNEDSENKNILELLLNQNAENGTGSTGNSIESTPINFGLFSDQAAVEVFLSKEYSHNVENEAMESALIIDGWRGKMKEAITLAIKNRCLTEFHVSLAPMVSHKTWVETCGAYIEQLKKEREYVKASVYLLATHKVGEAIKLLAENALFREALAIAKSRLPADDPIIDELLRDWASHSSATGKVSISAICSAASGQWDEAARTIVRKKTPARLLLASKMIAQRGTDHSTGTLYARECVELSLHGELWAVGKEALISYPQLKHLAIWMHVHSVICSLRDLNLSVEEWLQELHDESPLAMHGRSSQGSSESPPKETRLGMNHEILKLYSEPFLATTEMISHLQKDLLEVSNNNNTNMLWIALSARMTLALAAAPSSFPNLSQGISWEVTESLNECMRHVTQAMALLYNHHLSTLGSSASPTPTLLHFCVWLCPRGPLEIENIFLQKHSSCVSSIRAFFAAGILFWLQKGCDKNVWLSALHVIDQLKTDVFSLESLKWFKADFKVKLLQSVKMNAILKEKQDVSSKAGAEILGENVKALNTGMAQMTLSVADGEESKTEISEENSHENSTNGVESDVNPEESQDELVMLTQWLKVFEDSRVKVPNPYLCYSHLSSFLKNVFSVDCESEATDIMKHYEEFWENVQKKVDM